MLPIQKQAKVSSNLFTVQYCCKNVVIIGVIIVFLAIEVNIVTITIYPRETHYWKSIVNILDHVTFDKSKTSHKMCSVVFSFQNIITSHLLNKTSFNYSLAPLFDIVLTSDMPIKQSPMPPYLLSCPTPLFWLTPHKALISFVS